MNNKFKFTPEVSRSGVIKGDNESEDSMWKGVSENDTPLSLMIRELIQNSIDANLSPKANIKICLKTVDLNFIDKQGLLECLDHCIDETTKQTTKGRLLSYKEEVSGDLNNLKCLIVEDESGGLNGTSRFNKDDGLCAILGENFSQKNESDLGSFGVGKSTAFRISSFGSVFYLNQKDGDRKFIGKTILSGFTKGEKSFYGPNIFCGKESVNEIEKVSDWSEFDDTEKIRSFEKDGLTTIIPVDNSKLIHHNIDWIEMAILSSIKSYFKSFESNSLTLTLKDEIKKKELIIDQSNYKEIYQETLNKIHIEELDPMFIHNILISKPFILNKGLIDSQEISVNVSLINNSTYDTEKFSGIFKVKMYENHELKELLETNSMSVDKTHNFRLTRGSILIRNYKLPNYERKRRLESNLYCGLVELKNSDQKGNSKPLKELIRILETQSHDTLDISKLERNYSNEQSIKDFKKNIIDKLNRLIINMINEKVNKEKANLTEIDINLDLSGNQEGNSGQGGYYREVIGFGKSIKKEISTLPVTLNKGDGKDEETSTGTLGDGEEITQTGGGKGKGGDGGGGGQDGTGHIDDEGRNTIISRATTQSISYKSKRILKRGKNAKYIIRCNGLKDCKSILFYQDSIEGYKNSIRMFDIKAVKLNGFKVPESSISKTNQYEKVDFELKKINPLQIEIDLVEPEKSITDFHLKTIV